jgi:hypothetical protein
MPTASPELMRRLRDGKEALRQARRSAPLSEKLRQLVYAQHLYVQVAGIRRQLKPWQRPWNILNHVRDSVVIGPQQIQPITPALHLMPSARSRWIRPKQQSF